MSTSRLRLEVHRETSASWVDRLYRCDRICVYHFNHCGASGDAAMELVVSEHLRTAGDQLLAVLWIAFVVLYSRQIEYGIKQLKGELLS